MADKSTGEKPSKKPAEKPTDKPAVLKPPVTLAPQRKQSFSKTGEGRARGSLDGRSPQLSSTKASPATPTNAEGPAPPPIALPPQISEENEDKKKSERRGRW
jgi:hypothetical protein